MTMKRMKHVIMEMAELNRNLFDDLSTLLANSTVRRQDAVTSL